jgi:hypothetical protein
MWIRARSIDFHERNPWAISWLALSPQNECFVYREWMPSPTRWVTLSICEEIARLSGQERYSINLIDPLAKKIQPNTGVPVIKDINDAFSKLQKQEKCTGGYWEVFDTKGSKGRDAIRQRLQNAALVERPFNNRIVRDGEKIYLPTLWIFRSCRETAKSLKQWRYEEWGQARWSPIRDKKEAPVQKYSHFCTAIEGIMKDVRFRPLMRGRLKKRKAPKRFKVRY